jgi:hypothetical protein
MKDLCLLRKSFADSIQNMFNLDTIASDLFVTSETTVKVFIPVEMVYLPRERVCLGHCLAKDFCSDSDIQAFRQHATIYSIQSLIIYDRISVLCDVTNTPNSERCYIQLSDIIINFLE